MLKYLKPRLIPITFVIFFFGNIMTFLIIWSVIGYMAFELLSVEIARILMIAGIFPALGATMIFYTSVLPVWIAFSIKKTENLHFLKYFLVQSKIISNKILENRNNEFIGDLDIKYFGDKFTDDRTIPEETEVKKSYADFFGISFCTFTLPVMFYQSNPENKTFAYILFVIGMLIGIREFIKLQNQKFSFKLSNDGVWISENELVTWSQVKKKKSSTEFKSDFIKRIARRWFFTFDYLDANKQKHEFKIQFNNLGINDGRLNYLIYIYKNRYLNNLKIN